MKKWFGLCIPRISIENEKDRERYAFLSSNTSIERLGYAFCPHSNVYEMLTLKEIVFMEAGIKNWVNDKFLTLKSFQKQGIYYKYELPAIIKDNLYYNNRDLVSYNYLHVNNLKYSDRDNYEITISASFIDLIMANNFAGIVSSKNVGRFKKDEGLICNFTIRWGCSDSYAAPIARLRIGAFL